MELVEPEISVQLDFRSDDRSMADCADVSLSMFSRDIRMIFMSEMSEMLCWSLLISSLFFWILHFDSSSSKQVGEIMSTERYISDFGSLFVPLEYLN